MPIQNKRYIIANFCGWTVYLCLRLHHTLRGQGSMFKQFTAYVTKRVILFSWKEGLVSRLDVWRQWKIICTCGINSRVFLITLLMSLRLDMSKIASDDRLFCKKYKCLLTKNYENFCIILWCRIIRYIYAQWTLINCLS